MRGIRDRIYEETKHFSHEELKEYFEAQGYSVRHWPDCRHCRY